MGRPRRPRPRLRGLRDGPHGAAPRGAAPQRGPAADEHPAPLDRRHLRLHGGRAADHHGHAGRPDRAPAPAPLRRCGVRARLAPRRLLDERGDADLLAGPPRDRGRDDRPFDALPHPQPLRRPGAAHVRDRRLDHRLLARRRPRPPPRRRAARVLLVGLGLSPGPPGDGAPPDPRAVPPARVPRPERRPARSHERRSVAGRRARRGVRAETDDAGRGRRRLVRGDRGGPRLRRNLRAPADEAGRPAHRPEPLPHPGLQRLAGRLHARDPGAVRLLPLHLPVPAARPRALPVRGGSGDTPLLLRFRPRLHGWRRCS